MTKPKLAKTNRPRMSRGTHTIKVKKVDQPKKSGSLTNKAEMHNRTQKSGRHPSGFGRPELERLRELRREFKLALKAKDMKRADEISRDQFEILGFETYIEDGKLFVELCDYRQRQINREKKSK